MLFLLHKSATKPTNLIDTIQICNVGILCQMRRLFQMKMRGNRREFKHEVTHASGQTSLDRGHQVSLTMPVITDWTFSEAPCESVVGLDYG